MLRVSAALRKIRLLFGSQQLQRATQTGRHLVDPRPLIASGWFWTTMHSSTPQQKPLLEPMALALCFSRHTLKDPATINISKFTTQPIKPFH